MTLTKYYIKKKYLKCIPYIRTIFPEKAVLLAFMKNEYNTAINPFSLFIYFHLCQKMNLRSNIPVVL